MIAIARAARVLSLVALALSLSASARAQSSAPVPAVHDVDAIDLSAKAAYEEGAYSFCKNPERPLHVRQRGLCSLAAEVDKCEGFRSACDAAEAPKESGWLEALAALAGPFAKGLLYLLMLGIIVAIAIPVAAAVLKLRRDRRIKASEATAPNRASALDEAPIAAAEIADAEAALRLADEHRVRGELERALGLYLAASLAALDRRGSIRIARHRTNGEYVRACEESAKQLGGGLAEDGSHLRDIVREVDNVEFGGAPPTNDGVLHVASRAQSIVRATTAAIVIVVAALGCAGCSPPRHGGDPGGDELPSEVLRRNGFRVGTLATSLATLPIPEGDDGAAVVIVDVERVPLENEAQAHMMRWVEAGGVLVLFGHVEDWPAELHAKAETAALRDLVVRTSDPNGGLEDIDSDADPQSAGRPIEIKGARTARANAFSWQDSAALAFLGSRTYAAKKLVGKGFVLGVANDDLFTNVGVRHPRNAAALVTLVRAATHEPLRKLGSREGSPLLGDVRIARAQDGIPPPANPFAALVAAGLGKGAWHALAAAVLLFLAYGIRHARARPVAKKTRRAFAEHVEATGAFYARARAEAHALDAYGRFMEVRLRESVPRGSDPTVFLAAAARSGITRERAAELYARAMQSHADDPAKGDELRVIEELRRLMDHATERPSRP